MARFHIASNTRTEMGTNKKKLKREKQERREKKMNKKYAAKLKHSPVARHVRAFRNFRKQDEIGIVRHFRAI